MLDFPMQGFRQHFVITCVIHADYHLFIILIFNKRLNCPAQYGLSYIIYIVLSYDKLTNIHIIDEICFSVTRRNRHFKILHETV